MFFPSLSIAYSHPFLRARGTRLLATRTAVTWTAPQSPSSTVPTATATAVSRTHKCQIHRSSSDKTRHRERWSVVTLLCRCSELGTTGTSASAFSCSQAVLTALPYFLSSLVTLSFPKHHARHLSPHCGSSWVSPSRSVLEWPSALRPLMRKSPLRHHRSICWLFETIVRFYFPPVVNSGVAVSRWIDNVYG